jgi:S-formylglutathione hydrolase FrmB
MTRSHDVVIVCLSLVVVLAVGVALIELGGVGQSGSGPRTPVVTRCKKDILARTQTGSFYSHARHTTVWYTIGYPPISCRSNPHLPLVLFLHGFGGNHLAGIGDLTMQDAAVLSAKDGKPMAFVAMDGGNGYWHPTTGGDNAMRMLTHELIPRLQRMGLGRGHKRIAVTGLSMGGYGTLLFGEEHPNKVFAIAAISPAVWTSWAASHLAGLTAFTSNADFEKHNVITHAYRLAHTPTYMTSGLEDPFHPYIESLIPVLQQAGGQVEMLPGSHNSDFFTPAASRAIKFLAEHAPM